MSNAIRFLEALGSQPADGSAPAGYEAAVAACELDEPERRALRGRDAAALARLLEGRETMICAVCTPDDESEHQVVPDDADADGDMVPDREQAPERD